MQTFRSRLMVLAAVGGLAVIGSLMNSSHATAQSGPPGKPADPVTVVNTAANPVPVNGSITVSGVLPVSQSGPWNVGLTGGTGVRINNAASDPVQVREVNDAMQPFQATASCSSTVSHCDLTLYNVPAGKRAVIEYFSGEGTVGQGQVAWSSLTTRIAGTPDTEHHAPLTAPALGFIASWGQQVRMYSDPGSSVGAAALASGPGPVNFSFSISGYLVDVP